MQAITDRMAFKLPEFMASSNARKAENPRPSPLKVSRSFSRVDPLSSPDRSNRPLRASTIQNGTLKEGALSDKTNGKESRIAMTQPDVFEKSPEEGEGQKPATTKMPVDFDDLPIELITMGDRQVVYKLSTSCQT